MSALLFVTLLAQAAQAAPPPDLPPPASPAPSPSTAPAPSPADGAPPVIVTTPPPPEPAAPDEPPSAQGEDPSARMSHGRRLVSDYNSGFHWGLSPGVIFSGGKASFAIGVPFGYGFDTGTVIVVPGVSLSAYFTNPNVYIGLPNLRLVLPIDRFAPFIEGGVGVGYVDTTAGSSGGGTGAALLAGGGFMVHFSHAFALGAEASYQVVTGTGFSAVGVGPILAIGF